MRKINTMSLCDGHSCGMQTFKVSGANAENYIASEIKDYGIKVSLSNHPEIQQVGDIYGITEDYIKSLPFKIDIILSGSPCQSHSRNGKHGGFEDPRGEIFFQFVNVLNWIKEHNNPDVKFLFENVQMKKESADLISESLGVDVVKIDSKYFSPQRRLRYYWTNIKVNGVDKSKEYKYTVKDILQTDIEHQWYTWEEVNEKVSSRKVEYTKGDTHVISSHFLEYVDGEMRVRNATKKGYLVVEDYDTISLSFPNSKTRRGRVGKQKASTLDIGCHQMVYVNGMFREFTMIELERLQGLPDNYTQSVCKTKRKDLIGEGWNIPTIEFILSEFVKSLNP